MLPDTYKIKLNEAAQIVLDNMDELPLALVIDLNQATEKALSRHFQAALKGHGTIREALDALEGATK